MEEASLYSFGDGSSRGFVGCSPRTCGECSLYKRFLRFGVEEKAGLRRRSDCRW